MLGAKQLPRLVSLWLAGIVGASLAVTGCSGPTATPSPVPLASYVDVTSPRPDLVAARHSSGQGWYVLSFVLADHGRCAPSWGGVLGLRDPSLTDDVRRLRADGGAVSVASGGALGSYLENACHDAAGLAAAYSAALDAMGTDRLDVDIEQPIRADVVAGALATLARQRTVHITVTVGVVDADTGIDPETLPLLRALAHDGTPFTVNAMVFDLPVAGTWRATMLHAADTVAGQFARLIGSGGAAGDHRLALTLMAGRDDNGTVTTPADAGAVRDYAAAHGLAALGLWSVARDNGNCPGGQLADDCSGIAQRPYEFTDVLSHSGT